MPIEQLLSMAGEAESPPEDPQGGIPNQKLSNWIRFPFRVFILPFILLDLGMQYLARLLIKPPYKKAGKCLKRGNCCHYILLKDSKGVLGKLFWFWSTEVNGFFLRDRFTIPETKEAMLVMGCRYLQKDGSCKHYHLRPMVCRNWPVIEHFGFPRTLKGCGYKAMIRKTKNRE